MKEREKNNFCKGKKERKGIKMKKILLLLILLLTTSCAFLEPSNYRECSYDDEDGLYYDYWEKYPERVPCKALNKKIERNRKK